MRDTPITYEIEKLNVGAAMTPSTGIFKAPTSGTYFFFFSGISGEAPATKLLVGIFVNDIRITSGYGSLNEDTVTIQTSLHLNSGDTVSVKIWSGSSSFYDSGSHYTVFTGWLMEEDLF